MPIIHLEIDTLKMPSIADASALLDTLALALPQEHRMVGGSPPIGGATEMTPPPPADPVPPKGAVPKGSIPGLTRTPPEHAADETPAADTTPPGAVAPAPPPPPPELDAEGREWNEKIHAGTQTKNKGDGNWKRKRGTDDITWKEVRAAEDAARGGPPESRQLETPPPPPPPDDAPDSGNPFTDAPPPPDGPDWEQVKASFAHMFAVSSESRTDTFNTLTAIFNEEGIDGTTLEKHPELYAKAVETVFKHWPVPQV